MEELNSHLDVNLLKGSGNKVTCFDDLNNTLTIIELGGGQLKLTEVEADSIVELITNNKLKKVQVKIADFQNGIKTAQQWINDYKKDLADIDNQIADADKQLKDAFSAQNADLVTTCNATLQALDKQRTEIANEINTQESYVKQCQAEISKLQK